MGYLHPEALDGVGGHLPDAVTVGSTTYRVGDGGVVDCERSVAGRMASAHGVDVDRLSVDGDAPQTDAEGGDGDTCTVVKNDGEVCGRDRPCSYHD